MAEQSAASNSETPKTDQPNKEVAPEQFFAPAAIGLGVLLIVGGIILGVTSNKKKVAQLPSFSPAMIGSPTATANQSATPSETLAVPTEAPTAEPKAPATTTEDTDKPTTKGGETIATSVTAPQTHVTRVVVKKSVRKPGPVTPYTPPSTEDLPWYSPTKSSTLPGYQAH